MALGKNTDPDYFGSLRRLLVLVCVGVLLALFLIWRIDNARVEQLRVTIVDRFMPGYEWTLRPVASTARMIADLRAWRRVYQQNEEMRREIQRMQGWREAALQLEQKNARLLALNNVRLNPRLTYVTAEVMADAGSPFRRSAMVNVGRADGVADGATVVDGLGLVGRIAGVGEQVRAGHPAHRRIEPRSRRGASLGPARDGLGRQQRRPSPGIRRTGRYPEPGRPCRQHRGRRPLSPRHPDRTGRRRRRRAPAHPPRRRLPPPRLRARTAPRRRRSSSRGPATSSGRWRHSRTR